MGPFDIPAWPLVLLLIFATLLVFGCGFFCGRASTDWATPHIEWRK